MKNLSLPVVAILLVAGVFAFGEQPCKSTVVGDLRLEQLQSKTYGGPVTLRVWLPAGYSDSANGKLKYPTLYMFDGQTAFDECTAFHGEHELQIDEAVTRLISEHKIPPIIVIGIDSSSKRNSEYAPYRDPMAGPREPEPIGKQLPSFLAEEVLPFVSSRYRVTDDAAHRGDWRNVTWGVSGALRCAQSPGYVQAGRRLGLVERDTDPGTVKMVETLAAHLKAAYFKRPDVRLVVQPGANHSSQFWAQRLPEDIEFLYRETEPAR